MQTKQSVFPYLPTLEETAFAKYLAVPELRRLIDVGMHCGLEYTSFPFYKDLTPYSRFGHSVGVAAICSIFSSDPRVAISGLLHDIATPCFAHVVDFLNGDHTTQESTESDTRKIIASSKQIMSLLREDGISLDEVADYHLYPIADNDSPKLSADRLEYTLSNFINFNVMGLDEALRLFHDIESGTNEMGEVELVFNHEECALRFALGSIRNGLVYIADEDRFSMEYLARKLASAISLQIISREDLMTTEPKLIEKLCLDPRGAKSWDAFRSLNKIKSYVHPVEGAFKIPAKNRYIDPYVKGKGRLSSINEEFALEVQKFLSFSFEGYLKAEE